MDEAKAHNLLVTDPEGRDSSLEPRSYRFQSEEAAAKVEVRPNQPSEVAEDLGQMEVISVPFLITLCRFTPMQMPRVNHATFWQIL